MLEVAIESIVVDRRHRKTLGNVRLLADSIAAVGLLHPIVVSPAFSLVAGERRLEAIKLLGWEQAPVVIAESVDDRLQHLKAERDENVCRESFTPEEAVAVVEEIRAEMRLEEKAKERQRAGGQAGGVTAGRGRPMDDRLRKTFPNPIQDESARTSAIAAEAAGMSRPTYEKAKEVVEAAKSEPAKYRPLVDEMNRTGKVDGAFKKLKVARQVEKIKTEPPPLPKGPFRVIVADPPWNYESRSNDPSHRAGNPYPSMGGEQIKALGVQQIAHDDAILWLWTTNAFMDEAFDVARAWGFAPKTILTWVKDRMGMGDWLRGKTEHCLMAIRGKPTVTLTNQTTVLHAPMREHSRKPDEFYRLVESLCPGSKCEVFSRETRPGWSAFGDETESLNKEKSTAA